MSHVPGNEFLEWVRPAALPGTELLTARRCPRVWHMFHERYVVCACLKDVSVDWRYRGKTHSLDDGSYMLVEPGETHRNLVVRKPADFTVLFIEPSVVIDAARALGVATTPHLRLPQDNNRVVFRAFVGLSAAFTAAATALEQQSRLAVCLQLLLENYLERRPPQRRAGDERGPMEQAKAVLWDRFDQPVTLDELAAAAGLSRFHLLRSFVRRFGIPPHAYQNHVRVERARALLVRGVPPSVAAVDVGFADQSHLTRHFKRIHGVAPGAYVNA